MSRTVTLLGLTQVLIVVLGFFGLSIVLKYHGYPNEPFQAGSFGFYHWSQLTLFLRQQGFVLLLLPITWTVFAAISEARAKFIFPVGCWLVIGIAMPVSILLIFFYAIFHPCIFVPN